MNIFQKMSYSLIVFILLSSCSDKPATTQDQAKKAVLPTAEYLLKYPQSLPNFITSIRYDTNEGNTFTKLMCLNIWQYALWEPGIFAEDLGEDIRLNSQIMIDNEVFPIDAFNMQPVGLWHPVYANDELIGSYGDATNVCVDIKNLDQGVHLGFIKLITSTSVEYSYLWAFQIQ